jgi:DnaJ-class molecular chaperone
MRIPFGSNPAPLTCSRCMGIGRIETRKATMGKGWTIHGSKCPNCRGKGTLKRR